ncbi:polyhydroxybutyrate depolymerase [Roseivivax isoporae LMG 25204]|uniref:Polyhydroxybutyrate depolymerase n=2 Tax=Roseivivax TaxID=93682 RepID=X7FAQ7_9RHOB|nr:polyhydroxybutyrate depolymerase [Roseivivax isoporae LMG 25204]
MTRWAGAAALLLAGALGGTAQAGCGDDPAPCEIETGTYHVELPAGGGEDAPALVFVHGWGASGEGTLSMRGMVEAALGRGYAVIAPDGVPRQGRPGRTWGFQPERRGPRDEVAFLAAVRDDAGRRFGLDTGRMLLAGFSIGGSMATYLACATPEAFAAYAPVSGSFWRPHPARCAGPVRLLHTHGWTDGTVPLEGRLLRGDSLEDMGAVAQGDVWQAMEIWRRTNGCRLQPRHFAETGPYWRRAWDACEGGSLDFALFYGGHGIPPGWAEMTLDWFEGARLGE